MLNTVALVVSYDSGSATLLEAISDDEEIVVLEDALALGEQHPMVRLYEHRARRSKQDEEFGDYVEDLVMRPHQKIGVQKQALQWLDSKLKIEQYQKSEREAAGVIAEYAYRIFQGDPSKTDFLLSSSTTQVRIRIFEVPS